MLWDTETERERSRFLVAYSKLTVVMYRPCSQGGQLCHKYEGENTNGYGAMSSESQKLTNPIEKCKFTYNKILSNPALFVFLVMKIS